VFERAIFSHLSLPICSQRKPQSSRQYHWLPTLFDNTKSVTFWFKHVGLMRPLPKFVNFFPIFFMPKIGNIQIHSSVMENNNKKTIINNNVPFYEALFMA